ncbi:MAG: CDP-glycerol glycerophosphotransferase family protein [Motiliproteus sp.]
MKRYLLYISQNYSYQILRPLQAQIRQRGDDAAWFLEGTEANPDYLRADERQLQSIDAVRQYNPDVVLVPGPMVPSFIPGLKVEVFHGFDAGKPGHFEIRDCFDLYCTQGPNTTRPFQQLAAKKSFSRVIETGWPALDTLFQTPEQPTRHARPTILLCSTFSRRYTCAPHLLETVAKLRQNDRWQWLVQFHPKMDAEVVQRYQALQNDNLTFIETDNIIPLLHRADLMVCDNSSVLQMFLLLNKPVVSYRNTQPGPQLLNIEQPHELENAIIDGLSRPEVLMERIRHFNLELHPYTDGESSQRVLDAIDAVLAGKHPVKNKKPLNLRRNLKARRKLNYWKL